VKINKADIRQETIGGVCFVYVVAKNNKECFRREKTTQTVSIAHAIYMCEKYGETKETKSIKATRETIGAARYYKGG